jgi:CDP-paratose 2-epimerase
VTEPAVRPLLVGSPYAGGRRNDGAGRRVLVTGGAGFVGANLAIALATRHPDWEVLALDNLRRLNLPRLRDAGLGFVHGDVREPADLVGVDRLDALLECSAEPSALAGATGDTSYPVGSNLVGAHNCLELARRDGAQVVFLSTSRVYPYRGLDRAAYREDEPALSWRQPRTTRGSPRPA